MKRKYIKPAGLLMAVCMAVTGLAGCGKEKVATRTDFALDTVITIAAYGQSDEGILKEPFNRIRELDGKLNAFSEDSEISKINAAAGLEPVAVSEDTFNAVKKGWSTVRRQTALLTSPLARWWICGRLKRREKGLCLSSPILTRPERLWITGRWFWMKRLIRCF